MSQDNQSTLVAFIHSYLHDKTKSLADLESIVPCKASNDFQGARVTSLACFVAISNTMISQKQTAPRAATICPRLWTLL